MVVGNARSEANTTSDEEVAHDSLEAGLSRFEIRSGNQATILLGVLDDGWVESVLRRSI